MKPKDPLKLTKIHFQILDSFYNEETQEEIAHKLNINIRTLKNHIYRIRKVLKVKTPLEMMVKYIKEVRMNEK